MAWVRRRHDAADDTTEDYGFADGFFRNHVRSLFAAWTVYKLIRFVGVLVVVTARDDDDDHDDAGATTTMHPKSVNMSAAEKVASLENDDEGRRRRFVEH